MTEIDYKDFVPALIEHATGFLGEPEFEPLKDVLGRCNAWIGASGVKVVNMETVVLPRLHHPHEEGSEDVNMRQADDYVTPWNQFIRVWYRRA
jgi:hypothetical protein